MKTINFVCTECESIRPIILNAATPTYVMGRCKVCKSKIILNRKRLKKDVASVPQIE